MPWTHVPTLFFFSFFQEVIPYLNEHMEDNCSSELLGYVKNLVLARIQVNEEQVHDNEFPLTFEIMTLK